MTSSAPHRRGWWARARALSVRDWVDVARAIWWLGRARLIHRRHDPAALLARAARHRAMPGRNPELAVRIARAVPRAAARVPWRADCWVRAIAAQEWLARHRVGTALFIGVRKDAAGFAAHAWLRHDGLTVTGGDFSSYHPLPLRDQGGPSSQL